MSWLYMAACKDAPTDLFFPTLSTTGDKDIYARARAICDGCTVKAECLADAERCRDNYDGMRGGLTPMERRHIRCGRPADTKAPPRARRSGGPRAAEHGRFKLSMKDRCPCELCAAYREAQRAYLREHGKGYRARRKELAAAKAAA